MVALFTPKPCPDCGAEPVIHWAERWTIIFNWLFTPITAPVAHVELFLTRVFGALGGSRVMLWLITLLSYTGLTGFSDTPARIDNHRTLCIWNSAREHAIRMRAILLFGKPSGMFTAEHAGRVLIFEGLPRPGGETAALRWMDDKGIVHQKFADAGIPVPRGRTCVSLASGLETFHALRARGSAVIVKPNIGSRSRHTYVHITDEKTFAEKFRSVKMLSPWVIVHEELVGFVFRISLIAGKVRGVIRREPAYVIADGRHTVNALVEMENKNPLRSKGPIFHKLLTNNAEIETAKAELKLQHLSLESVPEKGRLVLLGTKTSRGAGGGITDVTDTVHPENTALFEKMARVVNDPVIGIDFIMQDMSHPWHEEDRCGAIEVNSLPFLDLHMYPLVGKPRDISTDLWKAVFPDLN